MEDLETVIAHEHYPARGGGEVVADRLADAFDAPIVTGWVGDPDASRHDPTELLEHSAAPWLRPLMGNPLVRDAFYAFAWESAPTLRQYDVVIQSGNAPGWYVPEQDQTVIRYNHSPPRNAFDLFWRRESHTASLADLADPSYVADRLYKKAARHLWKNRTDCVDLWVCNSDLVADRTATYLGVDRADMVVVYPPVAVDAYDATADDEGYYLALSRLEPSKRLDLVIDAFQRLDGDRRLKIVGDGNERAQLEAQARGEPNIEFTGYVSDERKRDLLEHARASVFAATNEDFGIVPIESMAAGTPVIGVRDGFTQYQVQDAENGLLFDADADALADAVQTFEAEGVGWSADRIAAFADQFGVARFDREMRDAVDLARERSRLEVDLAGPPTAVADGGGGDE